MMVGAELSSTDQLLKRYPYSYPLSQDVCDEMMWMRCSCFLQSTGFPLLGYESFSNILGEVWLTEAYQFVLDTLHLAFG
jgi:hypothetical protein